MRVIRAAECLDESDLTTKVRGLPENPLPDPIPLKIESPISKSSPLSVAKHLLLDKKHQLGLDKQLNMDNKLIVLLLNTQGLVVLLELGLRDMLKCRILIHKTK